MPTTLQFRRYDTANIANTTGAAGEIFIDLDKETVVVQDGSTAGGFPLAREGAYLQANAAYAAANSANNNAEAAYDQATYARNQANTARDTANGAYAQSNGAYAQANGAYGQANGAYGQANGAYGQANTGIDTANGAYAQANGAYGQANGAYGQANGAYTQANGAYSQANSKVSKSGDTMTGDLNVASTLITQNVIPDANELYDLGSGGKRYKDLYLSNSTIYLGSATINANGSTVRVPELNVTTKAAIGTANITTLNASAIVATSLTVTDPIIAPSESDSSSYRLRVSQSTRGDGSFGVYQGSSSNGNAFITFDSASAVWRLTSNSTDGSYYTIITTQNVTDSVISTSTVNAAAANSVKTSYDQATDARNQANTARDTANGAYAQANGAYGQANGAYGQANGAYSQANGAYAQANGAYDAANNAKVTVFANSGAANVTTQTINFVNTSTVLVSVANTSGNANVSLELIGTPYDQANSARDQANAAYADSNTRVLKAGDTMTGALDVQNYVKANVLLLNNTTLSGPSNTSFDGERLRLYDFQQAGHPNYAIGVEGSHIWMGVDDIGPTLGFKWYGNTTLVGLLRTNSTFEVSNTVSAKVLKASGTGTAVDASSGDILTNKVTGTEFAFLNGLYTTTVRGNIAQSADYTFRLPSSGGVDGFVLATDGTGNTIWSNGIYELANTVREQANTARTTANDAYGQANTARDTANGAYGQANGAYAQANGGFAQANGAYAQANGAYAQANGAYAQANGAYAQANLKVSLAGDTMTGNLNVAATIITQNIEPNLNVTYNLGTPTKRFKDLYLSNSTIYIGETVLSASGDEMRANVFNAAVSVLVSGVNVLDTANGAYAQANGAYGQANGAYAQANGAYAQANSARDVANGAYAQANGAYGQANGAYGQANGAYAQANGAYNAANNAKVTVYANSGSPVTTQVINFVNTSTVLVSVANTDGNSNVTFSLAGTPYDQANAARLQANNAYAEANLKLNLTGGTISGSLNVSGNLAITGNTTYYNVTTYSVDDPLIYLAANNETSDLVDIGFMGGHNTGGVYQHSGLARDASDGTWYLFTGLSEEGHENNVVDFANTTLATLRANVNANSILLTGNAVSTQANLTLAHNQANTARDTANGAYGQANGAYAQANGAYSHANIVYAQANTARDQANSARDQANTARDQANTARTTANDAYGKANTAETIALNSYGQANAARNQANTAYGQANDAYGQANSARNQANTAYGQANAAYNAANNAKVTVYANGNSGITTQGINYVNTATIQVAVTASGSNANVEFITIGDSSAATVQAAYAQANTARNTGNSAYGQANTATTNAGNAYDQANTARGQANTARDIANSAYGQANTATTNAGNAYGQANTATTNAGNAYGQANTATTNAGNAYGAANTAQTNALNAYGQANTARDQANTARTQANTAYDQANSAYGAANNRVLKAGDTMTGILVAAGIRNTKNTVDGTNANTSTGAANNINLDESNFFTRTLTASVAFTFRNAPASGNAQSFTLVIVQNGTGGYTPSFTNTIYWAGASAPPATTAANARDVWQFTTFDGGSTYYGTLSIKNAG